MMQIMDEDYIKTMINEGLLAVIFPKDKTEESAKMIADLIDSAVGIGWFEGENGAISCGVLIDKIKEAKKHVNKSKEDDQK